MLFVSSYFSGYDFASASLPNRRNRTPLNAHRPLTKMLTALDLRYCDFEAGTPVERWHSGPAGSS